MVLTRWDPLYEIRRARGMANRHLVGFPQLFSEIDAGITDKSDWSVPLDIFRDGGDVTIKASLPGVNPTDIDITIEGGVLTIKAETETENEGEDREHVVRERRTGSFQRSIRLSEHVDTENVDPRYENGILTITLPLAESKEAKHLTVTVGSGLPASG